MSDSEDSEDPFEISAHQQTSLPHQPLLFLLLTYYAEQHLWSEQQVTECSQQQTTNILTAIELPPTEANLRVLMRSSTDDIDQLGSFERSELAALYQFLDSNVASLLGKKSIPHEINGLISLAELLVQYPDLVTARFIQRSPKKDYRLYTCLSKIDSLHRLAQLLNITNMARRIRRCRHYQDLSLLLRKLQNRASDRIVDHLAQVDPNDVDAVINCIGV